jgi:hypothetical protein
MHTTIETHPVVPIVRRSLNGPCKSLLLAGCLLVAFAAPLAAGTPTVTSFVLGPNPTLSSATFVVTFSEPVTGVDQSDFAVNSTGTASATITGVTANATGAIYTVAFNYTGTSGSLQMAIRTAATGIVSVSTSDPFAGSGVAASPVIPVNSAPPADATAPAVASFTSGTASGSSVNFTLTFTEPVTGVDAADFLSTRTGSATATIGAITANATGTTYTIPVTFGGTGTVQLTAIGGATTNLRDAATHWFAGGAGSASTVFTIPSGGGPDTTAPTVSSLALGATTATSVAFTLTLSEPVTGVDASDFSVATTGGATATIGAVSGSGASYTIPVNFTGTGTVQLSLNASGTGIMDASTNALVGGASGPIYTIPSGGTPPPPTPAAAPTIVSFTLAPNPTATTASFVVTFSEPVTGVDATDFAFNTTGTATATITGVTADPTGAVHTVAFNYGGAAGSIQLGIKTTGTGIAGATTNAFVGGGVAASAVVPVNNAPPADSTLPTIASFAAGTAAGSVVNFTLTFSEPVTGVEAADFLVARTGTATAAIGTITANATGTTYTIPVTFGGAGTVQLTAIGGVTTNIRDVATHWFAGGSGAASTTFTIPTGGGTPDTTAPTVATFTLGTTTATSVTFNLVFSEPVTGVDAGDFGVATTGGATATIGTVTGSGTTYAIPVNFIGTAGTVQLSLNAAGTGIVDAAGNGLAAGASGPIFTITSGGGSPGGGTQIIGITPPPNGSYRKGDELIFVVRFSGPVSIAPEPNPATNDENDDGAGVYFTWTAVGSTDPKRDSGKVHYRSGSGTDTWTFVYKVRNGDVAPNGILLGTVLHPDDAAVRDGGGALSAAQLTLPWAQNPLTGVILDAPKLNNGVGIGVGGTPPGHGGPNPGNGNGGNGNSGNGNNGNDEKDKDDKKNGKDK